MDSVLWSDAVLNNVDDWTWTTGEVEVKNKYQKKGMKVKIPKKARPNTGQEGSFVYGKLSMTSWLKVTKESRTTDFRNCFYSDILSVGQFQVIPSKCLSDETLEQKQSLKSVAFLGYLTSTCINWRLKKQQEQQRKAFWILRRQQVNNWFCNNQLFERQNSSPHSMNKKKK